MQSGAIFTRFRHFCLNHLSHFKCNESKTKFPLISYCLICLLSNVKTKRHILYVSVICLYACNVVLFWMSIELKCDVKVFENKFSG